MRRAGFGILAFVPVVLLRLSSACPGGDHDHGRLHGRRAFPTGPITPPTRPLVWGDVNVIHTTDTHGWLLGHQKASAPEPNYRLNIILYWGGCALLINPNVILVATSEISLPSSRT